MPLSPFPQGLSTFGVPVLPGAGTPPITGSVFWVDSGDPLASDTSSNGTFDKPFASIDYAVGRCTASNNDFIFVKAGHNESVIAAGGLDLDVAGITIVFLGEGADRAKITFGTVVGADMDIDAASVTLVNPKFVAGLDALTGPIDVNAADFTMINAEYHDGTSINTTDAVIADSTATRLRIFGYRFVDGDAGGTQKESHIQLNGCDNIILKDIDIRGDFQVGCVENVTDEVLNARFENWNLENTKAGGDPALFLDANATGSCINVQLHVATGTAYASSYAKMSWDARSVGFSGVSAPAGMGLGTGGTTSDLVAAASNLTIVASDLVKIASDCNVAVSNLATSASDIVVIQSNLTVAKSDIVVIQSNLTVAKSDIVTTLSNVVACKSDLVVLQVSQDSDMVVLKSDIVSCQSNLAAVKSDLVVLQASEDSDMVVLKSDIAAVKSDLVVIQASEDSDMVVLKSDIAAVKSDLVVLQVSQDSDMVVFKSDIVVIQSNLTVAKSDIVTILSNLTAFMAKYASDVP